MMTQRRFAVAPAKWQVVKGNVKNLWTSDQFNEFYFATTKTKRASEREILAWYRTNGYKVTKL